MDEAALSFVVAIGQGCHLNSMIIANRPVEMVGEPDARVVIVVIERPGVDNFVGVFDTKGVNTNGKFHWSCL